MRVGLDKHTIKQFDRSMKSLMGGTILENGFDHIKDRERGTKVRIHSLIWQMSSKTR